MNRISTPYNSPTYQKRLNQSNQHLEDHKAELKEKLSSLIEKKVKTLKLNSEDDLTDAHYRDILDSLHNATTSNGETFHRILNDAGIKTVSKYSWFSNQRSTGKIEALKKYLEAGNVLEEDTSVVNDLTEHPALQELYKLDSLTFEYPGLFGVKSHTKAVIGVFNTHFKKSFKDKTSLDPELMVKLLALHDIGKGPKENEKVSLNQGNTSIDQFKETQHARSKTVIKEKYEEIKITKTDANFISDIIAQDAIGLLLQKKINLSQATLLLNNSYVKALKAFPELTRQQYMEFIKIYYISDAASYPFLKRRLFNTNLQFKSTEAQTIDQLTTRFNDIATKANAVKINHAKNQIRYYEDQYLFLRDFDFWFAKNQEKFPKNGQVVFDIDGTITDYEKNSLKPYMKTVIQRFVKQGIKVTFLTNRSGEAETNMYGGNLHLEIKEIAPDSNIIYNTKSGAEWSGFKAAWFKEQTDSPIISSFGDNLNDLHGHWLEEANKDKQFKSRSWYLQIGKADSAFKQQIDVVNV